MSELFARRIEPIRNSSGTLCGLCDGTDGHAHPQVECSRCGRKGLEENWPFGCCIGGGPDIRATLRLRLQRLVSLIDEALGDRDE